MNFFSSCIEEHWNLGGYSHICRLLKYICRNRFVVTACHVLFFFDNNKITGSLDFPQNCENYFFASISVCRASLCHIQSIES